MVKLFAEILLHSEGSVFMGYIHCCSGLRKTRSFVLAPQGNFVVCELDYLKECPVCGHFSIQLTRLTQDNKISTIRYINKNAQNFWEKIQPCILYERKYIDYSKIKQSGNFYLNYNEFGVKKRCYSNLSNLKIGLNSTF